MTDRGRGSETQKIEVKETSEKKQRIGTMRLKRYKN